MDFFIGIDIGTTSTKAVAFTGQAQPLGRHSVGYPMHHPAPGHSEQDPAQIFAAVLQALPPALAQARAQGGTHLRGVAFSAAMHSLLAVDAAGRPLTPLMIWADNRAQAEADELKHSPLGQSIYERTGVPIHPMSPLVKLRWLQRHQPPVFAAAHRFIGIKEFVFYQLFGQYLIDHSLASATGLFGLRTLAWDPLALEAAGLTAERLSQPVPPVHYLAGPVAPAWAAQWGLPAGTPVYVGGSDGGLANLGSGVVAPGRMALTVGTSGAVRIALPGPQTDAQARTFCYALTDGLYLAGGGMNNGGVVLQWWANQRQVPPETLLAEAETAPPGADGLLFLPYLLGERAPLWDTTARGHFIGLAANHTPAHLARAVLEGVVYALFTIAEILDEQQPSPVVYASGGFAQSALWVQMVADVFGRPVVVADTVESSALGAVLVAMKHQGRLAHWAEAQALIAPSAEYQPNPALAETYRRGFAKFKQLYEALRPFGRD